MREMFLYKNHLKTGVYISFFFLGIFAGIFAVQMQNDTMFAGIFSEYFLNQYASLRIDFKKLLVYIARCRLGQYFVLIACGMFSLAPLVFGILLFVLGMSWGTMVSISILRLGFKGVMICFAGLIPQLFFYLPAFGWIFIWIWQRACNRKKYLFFCVAGFIFLLFGITTEVYLNPTILQQVLRKLTME